MMRFIYFATAVAGLLAASSANAANLVQNGGFETGDFTDWTLSGNTGGTFVTNTPNAPHSGSFAAELGAVGSDDLMSQTIATAAGQLYDLSFWHIYAPGAGAPGDFGVQWNGNYIFGPIASTTPPSPQQWTQYSFQVTGTGSDVLTFVSRQDPSYQGLDDISLDVGGSVGGVPEPATWITMLLGFAAIGTAMRRRQRQTVGYSFG